MVEIVKQDVKVAGKAIGEYSSQPHNFIQLTLPPKTARFVRSALQDWLTTTSNYLEAHEELFDDPNYTGWDWNDVPLFAWVIEELDRGEEMLKNMWEKERTDNL